MEGLLSRSLLSSSPFPFSIHRSVFIARPSSSSMPLFFKGASFSSSSMYGSARGQVKCASASFPNTCPSPDVLRKWNRAEAVCFDVDSTVCLDEGIDELARFCGAGEAVAALTSRAMVGSIPFEDALAARLNLIKPTSYAVDSYLASNPPRTTPGITELVEKLQARGTDVYLISGGFRQMIDPVAALLRIPRDNIFANRLLFGSDGQYLGFDVEEPTSRSSGKAVVVSQIKQKFGYKTLVMIGDGATDLEARRPGGADIFICYGGVQLRPNVAAEAEWLVLSFSDLIDTLNQVQLESSQINNG